MNIAEYIRNHPELSELDFGTVYYTIVTLVNDGFLMLKNENYTASTR